MSAGLLYALAGSFLFVMGAAGAIVHAAALRRILAFNVMGSGAFLVLVGLAQRLEQPDPVPQAMVLTGIVVAVASTALALALIRRSATHPDEAVQGADSVPHARRSARIESASNLGERPRENKPRV